VQIELLKSYLKDKELTSVPLIVVCDDAEFTAENINNLVWVAFTRSNPASDIDGVDDFTENKHWGCNGSLIIDARTKPHHAPELIKDTEVEKNIDRFWEPGGSLFGM
jgi:4-hydroxy-3-polyprenylbenzoate decarboxylase